MSIALSYTSVSAYKSCPLFFRYKYVDKLKPSIPQNNRWFIEGSVVHECLEQGFKHSQPIDKEFINTIFDSVFNKVFAEQSSRGIIHFMPGETKETIRFKCREILELSINTVQKMGMDVGEFRSEYPIGTYWEPFELDKGLFIQGSVDWLRETPDGIIISDFKTSKDTTFIKAMQLVVYAVALEKKFKKPVNKAFYLMFRSGAQIDVPITEERKKEAIKILQDADINIKSGKFTANPSNKVCRECVFRNICKSCSIKYGPMSMTFEDSLGSK